MNEEWLKWITFVALFLVFIEAIVGGAVICDKVKFIGEPSFQKYWRHEINQRWSSLLVWFCILFYPAWRLFYLRYYPYDEWELHEAELKREREKEEAEYAAREAAKPKEPEKPREQTEEEKLEYELKRTLG